MSKSGKSATTNMHPSGIEPLVNFETFFPTARVALLIHAPRSIAIPLLLDMATAPVNKWPVVSHAGPG